MRRALLCVATVALILAAFSAVPSNAATVVNATFAGHWITLRGGPERATLDLATTGQLSGRITGGRFGTRGCEFQGVIRERDVALSNDSLFLAIGSARFVCTRRTPPLDTVVVQARPNALRLNFRHEGRDILEVQDMSRSNGGSGKPPPAIDPAISGQWQGTDGGIRAAVNLTVDGSVSGTVSGSGKEGCTFIGSIAVENVIRNSAASFVAVDVVAMNGCANPSLNGLQGVVIVAGPTILGIGFLDPEDEGAVLFKVDGLSRTGDANPD